MQDNSLAARELSARIEALGRLAPSSSAAFRMLLRAALGREAQILTPKARSLMALAMSLGCVCECCLEQRVRRAFQAGATHDDIVRALECAVFISDRPAMAWAAHALTRFDEIAAAAPHAPGAADPGAVHAEPGRAPRAHASPAVRRPVWHMAPSAEM